MSSNGMYPPDIQEIDALLDGVAGEMPEANQQTAALKLLTFLETSFADDPYRHTKIDDVIAHRQPAARAVGRLLAGRLDSDLIGVLSNVAPHYQVSVLNAMVEVDLETTARDADASGAVHGWVGRVYGFAEQIADGRSGLYAMRYVEYDVRDDFRDDARRLLERPSVLNPTVTPVTEDGQVASAFARLGTRH